MDRCDQSQHSEAELLLGDLNVQSATPSPVGQSINYAAEIQQLSYTYNQLRRQHDQVVKENESLRILSQVHKQSMPKRAHYTSKWATRIFQLIETHIDSMQNEERRDELNNEFNKTTVKSLLQQEGDQMDATNGEKSVLLSLDQVEAQGVPWERVITTGEEMCPMAWLAVISVAPDSVRKQLSKHIEMILRCAQINKWNDESRKDFRHMLTFYRSNHWTGNMWLKTLINAYTNCMPIEDNVTPSFLYPKVEWHGPFDETLITLVWSTTKYPLKASLLTKQLELIGNNMPGPSKIKTHSTSELPRQTTVTTIAVDHQSFVDKSIVKDARIMETKRRRDASLY